MTWKAAFPGKQRAFSGLFRCEREQILCLALRLIAGRWGSIPGPSTRIAFPPNGLRRRWNSLGRRYFQRPAYTSGLRGKHAWYSPPIAMRCCVRVVSNGYRSWPSAARNSRRANNVTACGTPWLCAPKLWTWSECQRLHQGGETSGGSECVNVAFAINTRGISADSEPLGLLLLLRLRYLG